jgi:triacylglycerol lipase
MSAVVAVPELMAEAATDLATVGSNLSAAHMTAAAANRVGGYPRAKNRLAAATPHQ